MATYEKAGVSVREIMLDVLQEHHPLLVEVHVKVDVVKAYATVNKKGLKVGVAIKHHGCQAAAVVRVIGLKDRAMGRADAEIVVDGDEWDSWTHEQHKALFDHELLHLLPVRSRKGALREDDLGRPKLKLRPHDVQFGWFREIAKRNGEASFELQQARKLIEKDGQFFFPWITAAPKKGKSTGRGDAYLSN